MQFDTQQPSGVGAAAGADLAGNIVVTARKTGWRRPPVYAAVSWPRPANGRPASEDLSGAGVETAGVLPIDQVLTVWLEAPFASKAKARRVFPSLLDIQLPFPVEECAYAFYEAPLKAGSGRRVLAVVARLDSIRARLRDYCAAGVDPVRLDCEGLALWTQALDECGIPEGWRMVLHAGPGRLALAIGKGAVFQNAHAVNLPEGAAEANILNNALAPVLAAEANILNNALAPVLAAEMEMDVQREWVLTGPLAEDSALRAAAGNAPVRIVHDSARFLGRALAARALRPGPLRCNFRSGEFAHPIEVRRNKARRRRSWQALAGVALAVSVLVCAWPLWSRSRLLRLDREILNLASELAPGTALVRGQEIREVEMYQAALDPFLEAWTGSLLPELGLVVQTAAASGVHIGVLRLQHDELILEGSADPWRRTDGFTEALRALGWIIEVQRGAALPAGGNKFVFRGKRSL